MDECNSNSNYNAWGKARSDVSAILRTNTRYIPISYDFSSSSKLKNIQSFLSFFNNCKKLKSGDYLIVQNHFMFFKASYPFLQRIKKRGINIVFIIHDLNGLRMNSKRLNRFEMRLLDSSIVVAHTESMKEYIYRFSTPKACYLINIFPYLINEKKIFANKTVDYCFAGNLSKSQFLQKLPDCLLSRFSLFGKTDSSLIAINNHYYGAYEADEIPFKLNGKYGIIWDGNSLDGCKGISPNGIDANYLRYNSPHKFALYISSGIPVICWKESAIAEFVIKNNLGKVIGSLADLSTIDLNENYDNLKKSVEAFRELITTGDNLRTILEKAITD